MQRVILIHHGPAARKDRAADQLEKLGYDTVHLHPHSGDAIGALDGDVAGTIVYGGKYDIADIETMPFLQDEIRWLKACMAADLPVLGICQGAQMIAHILGAEVGPDESGKAEFGYYPIEPCVTGFAPADLSVPQAHFHGFALPEGAELLAKSAAFPHQAFRFGSKTYGFQFHPEVTGEMFQDWQDGAWSGELYARPGAQSRGEQDARADDCQTRVDPWFREFLTNLFGPAQ